jgi:hypothetical protein
VLHADSRLLWACATHAWNTHAHAQACRAGAGCWQLLVLSSCPSQSQVLDALPSSRSS